MPRSISEILNDPTIQAALKRAWEDSLPGTSGRHEEGGFILRDADGNVSVARWPTGMQSSILLPQHTACKFDGKDIAATFHTHPNGGGDYLQEPSETDKRAVRDDTDLKGDSYEGEYVVAQEIIYLISPNGQVSEIGYTREILGE
jgi:proteasome lid subunit RPN8/RPN11